MKRGPADQLHLVRRPLDLVGRSKLDRAPDVRLANWALCQAERELLEASGLTAGSSRCPRPNRNRLVDPFDSRPFGSTSRRVGDSTANLALRVVRFLRWGRRAPSAEDHAHVIA